MDGAGTAALLSAVLGNRAQAYLKIDALEDALGDCTQALRLNGGNSKAAVRGAKAAVALGRFAESVPFWLAAEQLHPGAAEVSAGLAAARARAEDVARAEQAPLPPPPSLPY